MRIGRLRLNDKTRSRLLRNGLFAGCVLIGVLISMSNFGSAADEQLRRASDGLYQRQASGQVHLVEIDAKSLGALGVWPWPRNYHARLVEALKRHGAKSVAFDVDFSSRSPVSDNDTLFAKSLEGFGGSIILPTFRQPEGAGRSEMVDSLPLPEFRRHAFLASVNVHPDPDGQLRTYSYGTTTGGTARPTIATVLAGGSATVEQGFRIDTSIKPDSIPRHSFVDVLENKGNLAALRGKSVIIGATAIELGDRYSVPGHGIVPGPVVQAMATETLIQGRALRDYGPWPMILIATIISFVLLRMTSRIQAYVAGAFSIAAVVVAHFAAIQFGMGSLAPAAGLGMLLALGLGLLISDVASRFRAYARLDHDTGLPNVRALKEAVFHKEGSLFAVRLSGFDRITGVLTDGERKELLRRVIDRLELGAGPSKVHYLQTGVFGWAAAPISPEKLNDLATGLCSVFRSPVQIGKRAILVTPSIGVATFQKGGISKAISQATSASREAEVQELRWLVHNEQLSSSADLSLTLLGDITSAIETQAIRILYQPKVDLRSNLMTEAEALIRWDHPLLGLVMPDQFIPVLEKNKSMAPLTLHIVGRVLDQMRAARIDGHSLGVAVNISASLFDDPDFVANMADLVMADPEGARHLTLEVTESATISSTDAAVAALGQMRSKGVKIAIDDYGTGQSTLRYLKTFPADEIKIDKSFVTHMRETPGDQIVVRSTIEMAHELGYFVTAEGVENAECLALLCAMGCDYGQGWHFSKAIPIDELLSLAQSYARKAA